MKTNKHRAFVAVILAFAFISCSQSIDQVQVSFAEAGELVFEDDLSFVELEGDWAFWPSQFVNPDIKYEDFSTTYDSPRNWLNYSLQSKNDDVYASYAIKISNINENLKPAFSFPAFDGGVRYFLDGKELFSQGIPSKTPDNEVLNWKARVVLIPRLEKDYAILVMHISNFKKMKISDPNTIKFGYYEILNSEYNKARVMQMFYFGAIISLGAFFLALYVFNKKEKSSLWLGLAGIVLGFRVLSYEQFLLTEIFPFISQDAMFRIGYATFALAYICIIKFVGSVFTKYRKKWMEKVFYGIGWSYLTIIVFSPDVVFTALLVPFQITALFGAIYLLYLIFMSIKEKDVNANILAFGMLFLIFFLIHDILISNNIIYGTFKIQFGLLFLAGSMGLIITTNFTKAFVKVESLSNSLDKLNTSFSRFVPENFIKFLGKTSVTEIAAGENVLRPMCVMFLRLVFSSVREGSVEKNAHFEITNEFLEKIGRLVTQKNGFVDRFYTEGIVILLPDNPNDAVNLSFEIMDVCKEINDIRTYKNLTSLKISIGITRGEIILGVLGNENSLKRTAYSKAFDVAKNLALQASSRDISLIVCEDVAKSPSVESSKNSKVINLGMLKGISCLENMSFFEIRRPE